MQCRKCEFFRNEVKTFSGTISGQCWLTDQHLTAEECQKSMETCPHWLKEKGKQAIGNRIMGK